METSVLRRMARLTRLPAFHHDPVSLVLVHEVARKLVKVGNPLRLRLSLLQLPHIDKNVAQNLACCLRKRVFLSQVALQTRTKRNN